MTTKVTIDAHAGWPVLVIQEQIDAEGQPTAVYETTVDPGTVREFFICQHLRLRIQELPRPAPGA